jgi:Zn-finger nucleic acid-binding protein
MNASVPQVYIDQSKKIRSLSLDRTELRRLLELLQERSLAAGEIEVSHYQKRDQTDDAFDANKKTIKDGFFLLLTVKGSDGVNLTGSIETVFNSPDFPDAVASVYFDTSNPLRNQHNYTPRNKCVLFLDFTRPEVFNFSLMPSQETPNNSNFGVQGHDATWVHGVYHELESYITDHPSTSWILHRHTTYDLLVWTLGFPLGFWGCFRLSPLVSKATDSSFLGAALYVYIFLACLLVLRILFHYARWIWPLVEFRGPRNKSIKHKVIWSALALSLIGSAVYDLIKAIL